MYFSTIAWDNCVGSKDSVKLCHKNDYHDSYLTNTIDMPTTNPVWHKAYGRAQLRQRKQFKRTWTGR